MKINVENKNINLDDYLDRLVGKIFKLLGLLENEPIDNFKKHLNSLIVELEGMTQNYCNDSYIVTILFSLQGNKFHTDHNIWRKTVLDSINNVNKFKAKIKNS